MKVTAFIGSGRKRHSYNACEKFLQNLKTMGNVDYELVRLSEYNIGTCRGCRICFDKGEDIVKYFPSLWWLMMFRMARTSIRKMLDESWRDYTYFRDKGWFESDYFYPVKLNPLKKLSGKVFDRLAIQIIRS